MPLLPLNWLIGWCLVLAGLLSGSVLGLFFHREDFLGGYGSFRRRLFRLGHIALVALGMLNVLFSISAAPLGTGWVASMASVAIIVGGLTMPLMCFLTGFPARPGGPGRRFDTCRAGCYLGRFTMRIGLLAMSGVRAHDPKLLELGLTLPGFVDRSKVVASLPSLGLLYLAAVTPSGHDVRYYEAEGDGKEPAELYTCELVAISTFSAQVFEAYAIADRLRAAGVKVAMGGLHVSVEPDEALKHVDYAVKGEGENVWPAVVNAAERGEGKGIWDAQRFGPVDVARLPLPRYDLLADRPYNRFTVQTSRGCPWRCDFCASTVMLRQAYRKRPVADVIRDIRAISQLRGHPFIEFADDNTFVDKTWGKELCRRLAPLHLKWFTETDITIADDPELLELMREAGCRQVLIGLESPGPKDLEGIELRTNFKARRAPSAIEAVRTIQDHGITVNGCFILGLDEHTPGIFQEILDFAMEVPLYEVQITVLTPFPGTPLYKRLLREGRLLEPGRWDRCTLFDVNYTPKNMTPQELREGLYWLSERLYKREGVDYRRPAFFENLRRRRLEPVNVAEAELALAC